MTILPYNPTHRIELENLLIPYFLELGEAVPEPFIRDKLMNLIESLHQRGILHISLVSADHQTVGFALYQIDTPDSDWCKFPGWGCIREFYILPEYRRRGYGRALACHCETQLRQLGALSIYLTSDNAIPFWEHCGYGRSHQRCSNEMEILTK